MARWTRSRLSFANVMSIIAVFVALGGTSYAAIKIPKNSVGSAQIKTNGVASSDVKNGSLKKADFKATDLPAGPTGPQGAKGDPGTNGTNGSNGAPGTAAAFARVQPNGTLLEALPGFPATSKGLGDTVITNPGAAGTYCFDNMPFPPASAVVASDNAGASTAATNNVVLSVATERGNNLNGCPAGADARVVATQWTEAAAPANVNKGFVIWFEEG